MPALEILSGKQAGQTFSFDDVGRIGKDETCPIRIQDQGVSRLHAQISRLPGGFEIEDIGSANGTYINFKKYSKGEKAPLQDQDVVFFGRTICRFWAGAPRSGAGVSLELLRQTVPIQGLHCPSCKHDLEPHLRAGVHEAEQVEVIRRLGLHQLDPAQLEQLLSRAR